MRDAIGHVTSAKSLVFKTPSPFPLYVEIRQILTGFYNIQKPPLCGHHMYMPPYGWLRSKGACPSRCMRIHGLSTLGRTIDVFVLLSSKITFPPVSPNLAAPLKISPCNILFLSSYPLCARARAPNLSLFLSNVDT